MMSGSCFPFTMFIQVFLVIHSFMAIDMYRQKRFSKEEVCHEANATLAIVPSCPENDIMYQKRSKRKMCESYPKCLGEPLVYHCVRSKESLVEVCAPNGPIVGSCCAVFDRGVGRVVEDYSSTCTECPFKYQSVDCRNYSSCLDTKSKHYSKKLNKSINQTTPTYSTSPYVDAVSSQNLEYRTETTSQKLPIIILATALPAAIMLGCIIIIIIRYRSRIKGFIKMKKESQMGSTECSSKEKEYIRGQNNEPLIVNGNLNPT